MEQRSAEMKRRLIVIRRCLKPSLWICASFLLPIGLTYIVVQNRYFSRTPASGNQAAFTCQTIIADPNPPTNIRSSPIAATDNTTGQLPNGTVLAIVDENEGWLRINSPIQGWVYKELTVTSCINTGDVPVADNSTLTNSSPTDQGARLLTIALDQYQSGNLNGAIALAKTVSSNSPAYQTANQSIIQWQRDWERAESEYYSAQKSLRDGDWEAVINRVDGYPDIRYWKEKLASVVQQATQQKQKQNQK